MRFESDPEKNEVNRRKHGFDFDDASELFSSPMLVEFDDREDYGEDRWVGVGLLRNVVVVVAFTIRTENIIRIISMRKARNHERSRYEQAVRKRLGSN